MTTYYVEFIVYDNVNKLKVTHTVHCSEEGILRLSPELRDIWANLDEKLLRKGAKGATSKS